MYKIEKDQLCSYMYAFYALMFHNHPDLNPVTDKDAIKFILTGLVEKMVSEGMLLQLEDE